jgi:hypothetical protein
MPRRWTLPARPRRLNIMINKRRRAARSTVKPHTLQVGTRQSNIGHPPPLPLAPSEPPFHYRQNNGDMGTRNARSPGLSVRQTHPW